MKNIFYKLIPAFLFLISFSGCGGNPPCDDCNTTCKDCILYENHNISACGVQDPLRNIEWLKKYCNDIKDDKAFPPYGLKPDSANIYLYKNIDNNEHLFKINIFFPSELDIYPYAYTFEWKNCADELIYYLVYPGFPTHPDSLENFIANKELIAELFHYVKLNTNKQ